MWLVAVDDSTKYFAVVFSVRCSRWAKEDIREVHKRRYLLQVCLLQHLGFFRELRVVTRLPRSLEIAEVSKVVKKYRNSWKLVLVLVTV